MKPFPGFTFDQGHKGEDVKLIQAALKVTTTGQYGPTTADQVKGFQAKNGLPATGKVDKATWESLFNPDEVILPVRYFTQRDSEVVARGKPQAMRSCYSSSNAMLLEYLKPGTLPGTKGDDAYLRRVLTFGDTTDASAQIKALASYGIKAHLHQGLSFEAVKLQIVQRRRPVPVGFFHKGPVSKPLRDGHWGVCIGFNKQGLIMHDPFGELNLITGQYISTNGQKLVYSYKNFGPRWCPKGNNGWGIITL